MRGLSSVLDDVLIPDLARIVFEYAVSFEKTDHDRDLKRKCCLMIDTLLNFRVGKKERIHFPYFMALQIAEWELNVMGQAHYKISIRDPDMFVVSQLQLKMNIEKVLRRQSQPAFTTRELCYGTK